MSWHPRVLSSLKTLSQNLAPSVCSTHRPKHVALAVGLHPQRQVHRLVADPAVVADLDPQRVEEHHRVHRLQRPVLPGDRLRHDLVGNRADEVGRDLGAVALGQERLDLAHAHASGVHGDDPVIKPGEATFMLGDQDRGEGAVPVAGKLHAHRTTLGQQGLAAGAVALVGLAFGLVFAWPISQMQVHLRGHRPLDHCLLERQEQVLNLAGRHRSFDQMIQQLGRHFRQRPTGRRLSGCCAFLLHRHIHDF